MELEVAGHSVPVGGKQKEINTGAQLSLPKPMGIKL